MNMYVQCASYFFFRFPDVSTVVSTVISTVVLQKKKPTSEKSDRRKFQNAVFDTKTHCFELMPAAGDFFMVAHSSNTIFLRKSFVQSANSPIFPPAAAKIHLESSFFFLQLSLHFYSCNCRGSQNHKCRILQYNCRKKKV